MSLVEQARTRLEETRTKIKTRVETVRGGGSSLGGSILGGNLLGQGIGEMPKLKEIREKGVLGVLSEKFPKVKELKERGILARVTKPKEPSAAPELPAAPAPTIYPAAPEAPVKIDLMTKPRLY